MRAPVNYLRRLGVQVFQSIANFVEMSSCKLTGKLAIPGLQQAPMAVHRRNTTRFVQSELLAEEVKHPATLCKLHSSLARQGGNYLNYRYFQLIQVLSTHPQNFNQHQTLYLHMPLYKRLTQKCPLKLHTQLPK